VQNYLTGGKDNYEANRQLAGELLSVAPGPAHSVRQSRYFLARVIRWLAGMGISQFLDIGAGLPTVDSTHQIAQRATPDARTVYADYDPLVIAHARTLLTSGPLGSLVAAAAATLDFTAPVAGAPAERPEPRP